MKNKERIITLIPVVILVIQFLFHASYLWVMSEQLLNEFMVTKVLHICSYLIDIVAIVALFGLNKKLLSIYWILRVMFSIYHLISVSYIEYNSVLSNCFSVLFETMMYILIFSSTLKLKETSKEVFKNTYYIPIAIFLVVTLNTIIQHVSSLSTIINYCLSGCSYFCMAYWCVGFYDGEKKIYRVHKTKAKRSFKT